MRRAPTVFISSVVLGLEEQREKLCRIVTDEYGWSCNASGISDQAFGGAPRSACFNAIEDSDLYLGLFWKRSGSLVTPHNLFMTEMEFYHALNLRKSMRIYVLEAHSRDEYLRLFLDHVTNEPEEGQYVRFCKGAADLYRRVREDLQYFGKFWFQGKLPWQPPIFLKDEVQAAGVLFQSHIIPPKVRNVIFDRDWFVERVSDMRDYHDRLEFTLAVEVGTQIMDAFLLTQALRRKKELLSLWAEFLRMWADSCAWLGKIDGYFGAVWAAKQRRQTYRRMEAWGAMNESVALITNCVYVHANLKKIKAVYTSSPAWRDQFNKEHHFALQRAATYDEQYVARISYPEHFYRPYILREMGDYDRAVADLKKLLAHRINRDEMSFINLKSHLGTTLILKGRQQHLPGALKEGLQLLLESGVAAGDHFSSPHYLTVMKKAAAGILLTGDAVEAERILRPLYDEALRRKLFHQAWAIHAILSGGLRPNKGDP
jgi:tetratricopeptide (TPR) repeat protein